MPSRLRIGRGHVTQGVTHCGEVAADAVFNIRKQEPGAAVVKTGGDGCLGMPACLAGDAGFQRQAAEQQMRLRMLRTGADQPGTGAGTSQRILDRA